MNRIELLSREHDRQSFDCGDHDLNGYLRNTARQHMEKQVAQTYVIVPDGSSPPKPVLGFYTLGPCEITASEISPKHAQKLPIRVPAFRLGRLAVSQTQQGQGFGKTLLLAALKNCFQASELVGGTLIIVDAKNDMAATFYKHFDFEQFAEQPLKLFRPVSGLKSLFTRDAGQNEIMDSFGVLSKPAGMPNLSPKEETEAMERAVSEEVMERARKQ